MTGGSGFVGHAFDASLRDRFEIEHLSFRNEPEEMAIGAVDSVVHFAGVVHQMQGAPESLYEAVNVAKTVALAKKAKAGGVKQFVFMSSIKACGEESERPYTEQTACHPADAYGMSKQRAEQQLRALEDGSFKVAVVRAPLVYGEGVKANMLSLIRLVERFPVLPLGGIHNKRSMVYIGNLTHLVGEVVRQQKSGVFLAADDAPVSTPVLVQSIAEALGKRVRMVSLPFFASLLQMAKPALFQRLYKSLYVDNTQTVETLGLKNPYTFDEGVRRMVDRYQKDRD